MALNGTPPCEAEQQKMAMVSDSCIPFFILILLYCLKKKWGEKEEVYVNPLFAFPHTAETFTHSSFNFVVVLPLGNGENLSRA